MSFRIAVVTALTLATCTVLSSPARAQDRTPDRAQFRADLDAFVREAMAEVEAVPGLVIAVVDGAGVVHTAGYGLADIESNAPATADTPFYIASSTKSFTALALAATAARGEVDLDAPLNALTPDSAVPSGIAGRVTLTDLLSHRSGIDNRPIAYRVAFTGDWSPALLWNLTRETGEGDVPYGTFLYGNAGYNLATVLIEHRFQRDWHSIVRDEVLAPLGMTNTTADIDQMRASGNVVAVGYLGLTPGHPQRVYLQKSNSTMHSAGGLVSSANDMARWLQAQINDGVVDGQRVLPAGLIASTHVSRVSQDNRFGSYLRNGYGLGWQVGTSGDELFLHHFGNFAGSRAHVSFMPERRVGVAVMINEDVFGGELADIVADYVYDRLAGVPNVEAAYHARLAELVSARDSRRQGLAAAREARAQRPRMLTLADEAYVGDYVSRALGELHVRTSAAGLEISIGALRAVAENFTQPESVRVELVPFTGEPVVFTLDATGKPASLTYSDEVFQRRMPD